MNGWSFQESLTSSIQTIDGVEAAGVATATTTSVAEGLYIFDITDPMPKCRPGEYLTVQGCLICDSNCATCEGQANRCLSCRKPLPYLLDHTCLAVCPPNSYPAAGLSCEVCSENCASCYGSPSFCLTCPDSVPLLYGHQCVAECPPRTFQLRHKCVDCSGMCASCDNPYSCLTCEDPEPLMYNNECLSVCGERQYQDGMNCFDCAGTCNTCSGSAEHCLSCRGGTPMLFGNTCYPTCPEGSHAEGLICVE